MKHLQQNLLIVLALGLCGLCAWQWYVQTVQRQTIGDLNQMVFDRNDTIQKDTNSIATLDAEVDDLDVQMTGLKATVTTNEQVMATQSVQIFQLRFDNATFTNEIAQYKDAVNTLETRLDEANTNIDKQSETITNLLYQRSELVLKYDELATNRNEIVEKYNALVKQQ